MALYLSKRTDLVRFFTARTGSPTEAEDVVQEIYLKISAVSTADAAIDNAAAYLYRTGTNVMLDRLRTRRRTEARDDAYHQTFSTDAPRADPDAALDARRHLERIMRVVDALPPQCRRVFVMHKIEGLSYAEVAQALGVSKSAVEKHMITALKRLAALKP